MEIKFLMAMLSVSMTIGTTLAQNNNKALRTGDKVPDISFKIMNEDKQDIKLSSLKGKLVLLDFWSTQCNSCIRNFPKLDTLQSLFGDKIKIILVNPKHIGDDDKRVNRIFDIYRKNYGKVLPLSSNIYDTVAVRSFPHIFQPHIVWIDQKGVYRAATASVTKESIETFLKDSSIILPSKNDIDISKDNENLFSLDTTKINYKVIFSGYLDGITKDFRDRNVLYPSWKTSKTLRFINEDPLVLIEKLYGFYSINRFNMIVYEGTNPLNFVCPPDIPYDVWSTQHSVNYEIIVSNLNVNALIDRAKQEFEKYMGVVPRLEKRKVLCWVIKMTKQQSKKIRSNSKNEKKLMSLETKVNTNFRYLELPVIVDTNFDMAIFKDSYDEKAFTYPTANDLQKFAKAHGLTLTKEERELEVLVIKKINKQ